jgi:UDP-N-acetyl-D-galactosamine dehydrogenase
MSMRSDSTTERVAVIGLGYVGLPLALAFARRFPDTVGFDIDTARIDGLRQGQDRTREVDAAALHGSNLRLSSDARDLTDRTFFAVTVPTPVDGANHPDLSMVLAASETVGRSLTRGAVVVYESTVYPGATEERCVPVLERTSGLEVGTDFTVAYSPERINPGDREHTLDAVTKVVAGFDRATLERVAAVYGEIVPAGIHRAPSIKVAEAAKVIENTQRDLNVALMNELALICERLGIRTADVLEAARTKWNFMPFSPGLVGGHCIGVDPYFLTAKAQQLGYQPEVILAGRRINDRMGEHIAATLVKLLIQADVRIRGARIGILGLTFKENVPDIRNSKVPDIVRVLGEFGIAPIVHDPLASPEEALEEYAIDLRPLGELTDLDGLVLAVPHAEYLALPRSGFTERLHPGGVLVDVKAVIRPDEVEDGIRLWSL